MCSIWIQTNNGILPSVTINKLGSITSYELQEISELEYTTILPFLFQDRFFMKTPEFNVRARLCSIFFRFTIIVPSL